MAHVPDFVAGRSGVAENFHDSGLSTGAKFLGSALLRLSDEPAVYSFLSVRPRGDSQPLSLFSSLHAAPLGWHRAIACHLSRREKTGRVPSVVCEVDRALALQMVEKITFSAGISGSGHRDLGAVLGRPNNRPSLLGPLSDARGLAWNNAAHISGGGCRYGRHEFSENGGESVWARYGSTERQTDCFQSKNPFDSSECALRFWPAPFSPFDWHISGSP